MLGIFLDSETNGLNPLTDHVIEIALKIVDMQDGKEHASYDKVICHSKEVWDKSSKSSLEVNGFTWDMVKDGTPAEVAGKEIVDLLQSFQIKRGEAVFICQNPSFDRAFFSELVDPNLQEELQWPYHWLDLSSMHWAISIVKARTLGSPPPWEIGITKDKIAQSHNLEPEKHPHRAMNGVNHLLECYTALLGFIPQ